MMGETIPREENHLSLDPEKKDEWGIPLLRFNIGYTDNEEKMIHDFFTEMTEMLTKAGFTNIQTKDSGQAPGLDIHEMGGIRMGRDPKTSLLNEWNQLHACKNVFVTDGACMTSTSTQNPSLTYMALTARATNYAVNASDAVLSNNYLWINVSCNKTDFQAPSLQISTSVCRSETSIVFRVNCPDLIAARKPPLSPILP